MLGRKIVNRTERYPGMVHARRHCSQAPGKIVAKVDSNASIAKIMKLRADI
jgi:hypothetical protein